MKDSCRGRVGVDDAVCEDEGGPGYLMHKAGIAVTGYCGCWLEMIHLGRWTRYGADKEAALDLWVHTVNTDTKQGQKVIYSDYKEYSIGLNSQ